MLKYGIMQRLTVAVGFPFAEDPRGNNGGNLSRRKYSTSGQLRQRAGSVSTPAADVLGAPQTRLAICQNGECDAFCLEGEIVKVTRKTGLRNKWAIPFFVLFFVYLHWVLLFLSACPGQDHGAASGR